MSIVPLKKITFFGCFSEKHKILEELQDLGCIHITPLNLSENLLEKKDFDRAYEALRHLQDCPNKLKQISDSSSFDPVSVEQQVFKNKRHMQDLQDEKDAVERKIDELTLWGNFVLPDPKEMDDHSFWFYIIPNHEMKKIDLEKKCAAVVNKDNQFSYIVVLSKSLPKFIQGKEVKLPKETLNELRKRCDEIEFMIEDLHIERIQLTRWLDLFEKNLFQLEDKAMIARATHQTHDDQPLFVLQGWIPSSDAEKMRFFAKKKNFAIKIEEASPDEQPPTLLENRSALKGGEDLISFYMTPSYWLWDPSTTVFFSFAIFFAMIFSDAGYAVLLGAIVAFFWKRLGKTISGKRFRNVLLALTGFSFVWGVLVGSYFGIAPSGYLSYLKIIDMGNYKAMMMLAILVGIIHITLANLAQAWSRRKSFTAIASLGWAFVLIGGAFSLLGFVYGFFLMGIGAFAILIFTSIEKSISKRLLKGLVGLTRISGMFGDVMSYLRIFALGLASASLAGVFNDLAKQVYQGIPGFKLLFALLIIICGHGMNFALSVMSGFIHGLRLNFIEFFNWGLPEEGVPFKAFKKGVSRWNQ